MSVRSLPDRATRAIAVLVLALAAAPAVTAGMPAHQKKPVKLESTLRTEYSITQNNKEMGHEAVEKKTYDNNTVVFTIDAEMTYGPGVTMKQHAELTVEEDSYFPRSLHLTKNVSDPNGKGIAHQLDVEMFSNVAVITSTLGGVAGSRRLVVPTGVAIEDLGVVGYLYQTLFWYDRETGGNQRFQWLDPVGVEVHSGQISLGDPETISVMKKKTRTSVFKLERDRLGPATLWVDSQGTIVRAQQNMFNYELVSKKSS
ncbi:MAG TPA: hypothetical protein VFH88_11550 [Candidatus Krumholzibacteria bacterium]|nr:hypothetical protein [Candidatus Krumholzibacteria bacterium]